jgi:hypothetical protein
MSLKEAFLHDYLAASFIGLALGIAVAWTVAPPGYYQPDWGKFIGYTFVVSIVGFIPCGFAASYVNFRFHRVSENKEMAGLSAGFFTALVYTIIDLVVTLMWTILFTVSADNFFIAWIISAVFGFIFMPIGGYVSGFLEKKPIMMPAFFDLSTLFAGGAPPPPPPDASAQVCPTCGEPLTFVKEYDRWYCTKCKKYA